MKFVLVYGSCRRTDPNNQSLFGENCPGSESMARMQDLVILAVLINYVKHNQEPPLEKVFVFLAEPIFLRSIRKVISCTESVLLDGGEIKFGLRLKSVGIGFREMFKINYSIWCIDGILLLFIFYR